MTTALTFDSLVQAFHRVLDQLPDWRRGKNITYAIKDAALGAFAVFFTQSPSFLAYQQTMQRTRGRSNAESLFGLTTIPCDNQIRNLLDPIAPTHLFPMFATVFDALDTAGTLQPFRSFANSLLLAFDGTQYFSSQTIHCANCSQKTSATGTITYSHSVITPVVVAPGRPEVLALQPEFIIPQDGHAKQDCEQEAAKRWLRAHAAHYAAKNVTVLGDDLYCHQPFCELLIEHNFQFILVCKPESHQTLYTWVDFLAATDGVAQVSVRRWNGRFAEMHTYRYANDVPLRAGADALLVNWCEVRITKEADGTLLYQNAFATNHRLTAATVVPIVRDGRARWKIENENNNVLKTKGYHLEHNYGHGQHELSTVLVTLNLLAFVFHTVFDLVHPKYQRLRAALAARQTFFNDIRTLTRYLLFDSWEQLLDFMITQLELDLSPDTS
jgi:hypothetical protein